MGNMVSMDFLWQQLALLQQRSHPAWAYAGPVDKTRLWPRLDYNLKPDQHGKLMREIFVPNTDGTLPGTVFPLCNNNNRRDTILVTMPRCDTQGSWAPRRRRHPGIADHLEEAKHLGKETLPGKEKMTTTMMMTMMRPS